MTCSRLRACTSFGKETSKLRPPSRNAEADQFFFDYTIARSPDTGVNYPDDFPRIGPRMSALQRLRLAAGGFSARAPRHPLRMHIARPRRTLAGAGARSRPL